MNIVWLRNDLRLHDNLCLQNALEADEDFFLVYVIDDRMKEEYHGFQRSSQKRRNWLENCLYNLQKDVENLGGTFIIKKGLPANELKKLVKKHDVQQVFTDIDPGLYERKDIESVKQECEVVTCYNSWLWNPEDNNILFNKVPDVFTYFRKKVEKNSYVRKPVKKPKSLPNIDITEKSIGVVAKPLVHDKRSSVQFQSSEADALAHLETYVWKDKLPKKYKYTRNQLMRKDFSTKFSIWLGVGSLSPRKIYHEIELFEEKFGSSKSTYWIKFELTWRDFFRYQAIKHNSSLFSENGIQQKDILWNANKDLLTAFTNGLTGYPLVDAGVRELKETGFMSNRARQNVASFFTKNLRLDWRIGAAFYEKYLLDFDVASNYGNWQYVSSIGNDGRDFRYFNIITQAKKYDAAGYIKTWVPELQNLKESLTYEPWTIREGEEEMYDFTYGEDYPRKIVDFRKSINTSKDVFNV